MSDLSAAERKVYGDALAASAARATRSGERANRLAVENRRLWQCINGPLSDLDTIRAILASRGLPFDVVDDNVPDDPGVFIAVSPDECVRVILKFGPKGELQGIHTKGDEP